MKKSEIIQELDRLFAEMEPWVQYIPGYSLRQFKMEKGFDEHPILKKLLVWLKNLYELEFTQLKYARELVPEYMWANYKQLGIKGLQEQLIWKQALICWREVWSERYPKPKEQEDGSKQGSSEADQPVLLHVQSGDEPVQLQDSPRQDG